MSEELIDFPKLWQVLIAHFSLGDWSQHGPNHWKNVEMNGVQIAKVNEADETVVKLFAVFHDAERQNEGHDPQHGHRAAELAQSLHGNLFQLNEVQLAQLIDACRYHNDGLISNDVTIGTCWDADRLDLPRVGITPHPSKMSTEEGKRRAAKLRYGL